MGTGSEGETDEEDEAGADDAYATTQDIGGGDADEGTCGWW